MRELFIAACGLLSSCGVLVFSSLGVACGLQSVWALELWCPGSREHGLCSLRHAGSLVKARELSSCGARAYLPHCMWDLSSPTRDWTHVPCIGRWILYHWTTREVPVPAFFQFCICTSYILFILCTVKHTLCRVQFCGFWQRYIIVYLAPQSWCGGFPLPLKSPCVSPPSTPQFLAITVSIVLPFTKCHLNGIKHYLVSRV